MLLIALMVALCMILTGCGVEPPPTETDAPSIGESSDGAGVTNTPMVTVPIASTTATEPPDTDPLATVPQPTTPQPSVPQNTEPAVTEPEASESTVPDATEYPEPVFPPVEDKLEILSYGRYSGVYVEDGGNESVQNVAVILVKNKTNDYLDYGQLVMDIDGQVARFVVTGLPPGKCAWVLESSRLTVAENAVFTYANGATGFKPALDASALPLSVLGSPGQITLINTGNKTLKDVYVYFKVRHTDGNYLGGITYRKSFGDLESGATESRLSGHFDPETAEIVRITWNDEL